MPSQSTLTALLSTTPYTLAYALPLLFLSLLLTFAGTFFTLDRTRVFPKNGSGYESVVVPGSYEYGGKKRDGGGESGGSKGVLEVWLWGGVLEVAHLSTFLSLLIPATTSSPLGRKSFLAVWLLSCVVTIPLAGRYCLRINIRRVTTLHPAFMSLNAHHSIFNPCASISLLHSRLFNP
ncbi:hypothetical protein BDQ17DRAFT_1423976 [Cyathus striatus]|nr:hypothetical protein BDQ17DRAFT_1423976 [Cyathus striatus]